MSINFPDQVRFRGSLGSIEGLFQEYPSARLSAYCFAITGLCLGIAAILGTTIEAPTTPRDTVAVVTGMLGAVGLLVAGLGILLTLTTFASIVVSEN